MSSVNIKDFYVNNTAIKKFTFAKIIHKVNTFYHYFGTCFKSKTFPLNGVFSYKKDKRTDGEIIRNSVLRHKKIFFQMYKDEFNAKLVNIKEI